VQSWPQTTENKIKETNNKHNFMVELVMKKRRKRAPRGSHYMPLGTDTSVNDVQPEILVIKEILNGK
jgi:hypothetical protein